MSDQVPDYLTVDEVARLGRCCTKTVYDAIRDRKLRASKPRHRYLVRRVDAVAWIEGSSPKLLELASQPIRRGTLEFLDRVRARSG